MNCIYCGWLRLAKYSQLSKAWTELADLSWRSGTVWSGHNFVNTIRVASLCLLRWIGGAVRGGTGVCTNYLDGSRLADGACCLSSVRRTVSWLGPSRCRCHTYNWLHKHNVNLITHINPSKVVQHFLTHYFRLLHANYVR